MENFKIAALEKLEKESKEKSSNRSAECVKPHVKEQLISFIKQDDEFAQAVAQSNKSLLKCCEAAVNGCKSYISDISVYQKVAEFYFPGAEVEMSLEIKLCGSTEKKENKALAFSLSDLLE